MSHMQSLWSNMQQQLRERVSPTRGSHNPNHSQAHLDGSKFNNRLSTTEYELTPANLSEDSDDSPRRGATRSKKQFFRVLRGNGHQGSTMMQQARVRWVLLSAKAKLCSMLAIALLVLLSGTCLVDLLFSGYVEHKDYQSPSSNFAVVINTFKRPKQLAEAVRHYADTCGVKTGVGKVYIVWAEEDVTPPTTNSFFTRNSRRRIVKNRSDVAIIRVPNSLNSRFLPIDGIQDGVFMVDDDIRADCKSLHEAFLAWKANPDSMVGYYPRLAQKRTRSLSVYKSWPTVFWRNSMNFILTKACFLHAKYMAMYSADSHPAEIKAYVDKYFNCEDVAMSLLVANVTKAHGGRPSRPIYVQGSIVDKGLFGGISTGTGHMKRRSECLNDLTLIYRKHGWDIPLDITFPLRESSALRRFPGFWWQSRPSNFFEWFALGNIFK